MFEKLLIFTLSLAFSLSTQTTTVVDPNLYDVIVVGGGVSGLSTMSALAKAGKVNTLLIEGASRLGGRAHTIPFGNGGHLELGAQVINIFKFEGNTSYQISINCDNSIKILQSSFRLEPELKAKNGTFRI